MQSLDTYVCLSVAGLMLSIYALYIEIRKTKNKNYVAFCDFSENISCSRILTSSYSRGFGLAKYLIGDEHLLNQPNCVLGILFYTMNIICGLYWRSCSFLIFTSGLSCVSSVYLACILIFKIKALCLVCVATYAVNFGLLNSILSNCH